jgi:hypothetical protein
MRDVAHGLGVAAETYMANQRRELSDELFILEPTWVLGTFQ